MATKRFKDGAWRYIVKRKNLLPKPINLTFHDEVEGDKYVSKLESLLDKGIIPEYFKSRSNRLISALVADYRQMVAVKKDDDSILSKILEEYKNVPLDNINYHWAEMFVSKMKREKNLSPGTIRHYVGALARCLDWALAKEYISLNPLRQLPKGYAQYSELDAKYAPVRHDIEKDRRLEEGEEEAIRGRLNGELLLYFEIGLNTGMRLREIYSLTLADIDLKKKTIFVGKSKGQPSRQVPITSDLYKILYNLKEYPTYEKSNKTTARLSKQFARLVKPVAPGFTFHCLRHEFVSRLFERTDHPVFKIAKIVGHSSERMLARYANLRASDMELW